jgi:hypothetical protein
MSINHLTNNELLEHLGSAVKEVSHLQERLDYLKSPRFPADSSTPDTIRAYDRMLDQAVILRDRLKDRISSIVYR